MKIMRSILSSYYRFQPIENLKRGLQGTYRKIIELIYPPQPLCVFCGDSYQPYYGLAFCRKCLARIPLITKPVCSHCNRPLRGREDNPCSQCRNEKRYYEQGMAVAVYDGFMRELLHVAKYNFRPDLARGIGTLLAAWAENEKRLDDIQVIIPVPLHPQKLLARGYNQAQLMAEVLAATLRRPLLTEVLIWVKPVQSQSKLRRKERKENVEGAFGVIDCPVVAGKKVLLVDDICTTGYTLSEAAKALLLAGAAGVKAITAAIGVIGDHWKV